MSRPFVDYSQFGPRRKVRGGVEARSRRGAFGNTWWGRALVDAVEAMADSGRMSRGKSYARAGQVVALELGRGVVVAEVQGSQPDPFHSSFTVRTLRDDEIAELVGTVRAAPGMLAEVVSGSLPRDLGRLLLPQTASDLDFDCTCPDTGWPCKHVAAVVYLTSERVDERPLDMLTLRGIDVEALIAGVEQAPDDTDDLYGDATVLPSLPDVEFRPATDDLDPMLLRKALRALTPDPADIAAAERELAALYEAIRS